MRIAYDVSYIQREKAGMGRWSLEMLRDLLRTDTSNEYVLHGWSFSLDEELIHSTVRENVHLEVARLPGALRRFYWQKLRFPALQSIIGSFDVFHSADPFLPPTRNIPVIATIYDLAYLIHPEFFERRVLRWGPYVQQSLQRATAIVVPSNSTKMDLLEMSGLSEDRILVIYPPVPACFNKVQGDNDESVRTKFGLHAPFALFVGTLEPRKNIMSILKAFERLATSARFGLNLVIAGKKGWMYDQVLDTIHRSPFRSRIQMLDYVTEADLPSLYRLAQFFVYPSYYEGYGLPVVEAMASGLPVITSFNSSLKEIAGKSAILVDPANLDELCEAMNSMHLDSAVRDSLSRSGLERVQQLLRDPAAVSLLRLYKQIGPA